SGAANHGTFVPAGTIAPVVLQLIVVPQNDDLQVESETPLHESSDRSDVVAERRALTPRIPGSMIVAPPVLNHPARSHAHLEIPGCAEVALDEAWHAIGIRGSEYSAVVPCPTGLVEPPVVKLVGSCQID